MDYWKNIYNIIVVTVRRMSNNNYNCIIEMCGVIGEIFKHYSGNSKNDVL